VGGSVTSVGGGVAVWVGTLTRKILAVAMAEATRGTLALGMRSWTPVGRSRPVSVGDLDLDPVAGSEALGHVAGVGLDGQLD
jgi:hypothetical protein